MGRIRTIKPEFFLHEELFDLEQETGMPIRLAYAGLWCQADREGRFKWHPRKLKSQVLPYDECDFSRVLHALTTRGFVVKYASPSGEFGVIPSFSSHQVVNNRESASTLPDPAASDCEIITSTRAPRVLHACPTESQSCKAEGKGKEGKGKEQEGAIFAETDKPSAATLEPSLLEFPTDGNPRQWHLTQSLVDELSDLFPNLEILACARDAKAWVLGKPERRKTAKGMRAFLTGWLSRTQNSGRAGPGGRSPATARQYTADDIG